MAIGLALALGGLALAGGAGLYLLRRRARAAEACYRRAAEALEGAREQAQVASIAKSEFLASVSHEIRTPMTSILGFAALLRESLGPGREHKEWRTALEAIERNGRHLLALLDDILEVSRLESGVLEVEWAPCSVVEIIEDVCGCLRARAVARGLVLASEYPGELPGLIESDPVHLRQILVHLLGNAIKFTSKGEVCVRAQVHSTLLRIEVSDTGIGMCSAEAARVLDPFVQADGSSTRRFGGTGLGLTISRRLAEALGGELTIESVPGQGTTVSVTLATANPESGHRTLEAPRATRDLCGLRVLLAEESNDEQRAITRALSGWGAEVFVADDGEVALDLAREARKEGRPFDLVLADVALPTLDGYALANALRAERHVGPIVALSAQSNGTSRSRALRAGCDDVVRRPLDAQSLLLLVGCYARAPLSLPRRERLSAG